VPVTILIFSTGLVSWLRPERVIGGEREADHEHHRQRHRKRIAHAATVRLTRAISTMSGMEVTASAGDRRRDSGGHHDRPRLGHVAAVHRWPSVAETDRAGRVEGLRPCFAWRAMALVRARGNAFGHSVCSIRQMTFRSLRGESMVRRSKIAYLAYAITKLADAINDYSI
jgi:hypothetical protein